MLRSDTADWADRKSVLSALETGVRMVIARGVVDPQRIGITGLSDGAATAQYALVNSKLFAAAALSGCCEEPSFPPLTGPAISRLYSKAGYPPPGSDDAHFWSKISIAANADRLRQPILIQAADSEYLSSLYSVAALQAHDDPVDLYVFPDEYHIRVSPQHRLAAYRRAVQWFDFWLRGVEDANPVDSDQYARWSALKAARHQVAPPSDHPS